MGDLVISSDADCEKIKQNGWTSITVNAGLCNSMTDDLDISNYYYLESITVKGSTSSKVSTLGNLNSLTISNNPLLKSIVTTDGYGYYSGTYYAPFVNVKSVELTSK